MTLWHDAAGCRHDTVGLPRMTPGSPINVSKYVMVSHMLPLTCVILHMTQPGQDGANAALAKR